MTLSVEKTDLWVGELEDRPGALAGMLQSLSDAKANLQFALARRSDDVPGRGIVFLGPLKGKAQAQGQQLGLSRRADIAALHVEGPDKPGIGAAITDALAAEGINLRGLTGVVVGRKFACYLAFDSAADAVKAARALKRVK